MSIVRIAAFLASFFALNFAIGVLEPFVPVRSAMVPSVFAIILPVFLVICFRVFWDGKSVASLGLDTSGKTALFQTAAGFAFAAALLASMYFIAAAAGWITFRAHFAGSGMLNLNFIIIFTILLMSAGAISVAEELMFRGYIMRQMLDGWGIYPAIGVSAIAFGAAHAFNPGFNWIAAVNIVLSGILLAYAVVRFKSLWWPIGFHAAWNFALGSVFGFPVSGAGAGSIGVFVTDIKAPAWLMGGSFGPEGGAIVTALFIAAIAVLAVTVRKKSP